MVESVEVFAIESTSIAPKFKIYPNGNRSYQIIQWEEFGCDSSSINSLNDELLRLDSSVTLLPGEVPIHEEIYISTKHFNDDGNEQIPFGDAFKLLSFKAGDLIMMTVSPNRWGWFEGYRANDPETVCGVSHKSLLKRINFK